jgi:glycosyltransferase involved in cell wall biosynthesis
MRAERVDYHPNPYPKGSPLRDNGSLPHTCKDLENEASSPEVSVVMPCLNEADTLETCLAKAQRSLCEHEIAGEIIVADNGSTDGSQAIATRMGARVIHVESKGYGNALMGGIAAARGKFVIMGDADDSYDFLEMPLFVEKLRAGYELVQGCRLPSGGGKVLPGAMPLLHRWWGNPMFSSMTRRMFHAPIHDVYCGMRGFTKEFYYRLNPRCTGMEFATEMIIKASLYGEKIAEVPITLYPDGRKSHAPHLKTFRDGWRTFRGPENGLPVHLSPRMLNWFRCVEPFVAQLPLGAQYQVLCRKP